MSAPDFGDLSLIGFGLGFGWAAGNHELMAAMG
jgi:hypothetical protein